MIHRSVYILVVLCGMILPSSAEPATKTERPTVVSVTFAGNNVFSEDRLRGLMVTRPPGFLSSTKYYKEVLNDDISRVVAFYRQHGYLNAAVSDTGVVRDTAANEVAIELTLVEGDLTRLEGLSVFGNTVFPDSVLRGRIAVAKGEPFNPLAVENGAMAILQMYADTGYLQAQVEPEVKINEEAHRAVVDLDITENQQATIDEITIRGLQKTQEYVVRRELSFEPGDVISYSELLSSQRRLYLTGLFESVFIRPAPADSAAAARDILVEVTEPKYGEFSIAVGYGSVEKVRSRIEVSYNNLAGTGRQLGGRIEGSFIEQGITASFTEPRTFATRWQTDVNLLYELQQEPSYDLTRYGGRLTVGRPIWRNGKLTTTFRFENTSLTKVEPEEVPDDLKPRIRSLTLRLTNDTRDDPFDPRRGTYIEFSNELAGSFLQGTNTFARSIMRVKKYWPWGRKTTIAAALDLGWQDSFGASEDIPLSERFFAGGPGALRAFEYQKAGPLDDEGNPLGGKFKLVLNLIEVRRTIYKMFGAVVFVDVGNVFPSITELALRDFRTSVGPGIRAATPIGILRLDWGFKLDPRDNESPRQLYFSMGHAF
ncbi:outer membrane protein assembly factor BamA [candidate division GN15 bacterium]|nr:outer membrane protein assembly factor BamA [candidate division GN15 bacterium]